VIASQPTSGISLVCRGITKDSSALWCSLLSLPDGAGALLFRFASHEVRAQLEIGGRHQETASLDRDQQIRKGENSRLALDHALRGAEFVSIARSLSYPSSKQSPMLHLLEGNSPFSWNLRRHLSPGEDAAQSGSPESGQKYPQSVWF
jgi:hypothetical protein